MKKAFLLSVVLNVLFPTHVFASGFTRMDTLFITAATGEPRFQPARDTAEVELRAGDTAMLLWLTDTLARSGRTLTPRQNHYVERLFTVVSDSGRNAGALRVLAHAARHAPHDTARARWLYIGSRIGDTAFRDVARPWLRDTSESVRRMAVRVLGAYPHPTVVPLLWADLENVYGLERHTRLWALTEQPAIKSLPAAQRGAVLKRLAPLLADEHIYNRQKVRDMMLKASDSSWISLRSFMPQSPDAPLRREWWLLAYDAHGGHAFLNAERGKMSEEERIYFGVR
jgi:hypothetical protein